MHGSVTPWIAWAADFGAGPGVSGPATVVIVAAASGRHGDPWFVRVDGYPGLGSALAWDRPVVLEAGDILGPAVRGAGRRRAAATPKPSPRPSPRSDRREHGHRPRGEAETGADAPRPAGGRGRAADQCHHFDWYLDGARTHVSLAAAPVLAVRVTAAGDEVWLTDNEVGPTGRRGAAGPTSSSTHARWYEPRPSSTPRRDRTGARALGGALAAAARRDRALPRPRAETRPRCSPRCSAPPSPAGPSGGWPPRSAAGWSSRGADPLVVLVGGAPEPTSRTRYRPTAPIGRRARRGAVRAGHGLIANLSRIVAFGRRPPSSRADSRRSSRSSRSPSTPPGPVRG